MKSYGVGMKSFGALVLAFILLTIVVNAQSDWDTYPSRGIAELIEQEQQLVHKSPKSDMVISAQPFPSKTVVTYTGAKRDIDDLGRFFIKMWAESRGLPAANADMLMEEVLLKEKDKSYWVPVIKTLTPFLQKELQPGDEIAIYYFYLGGFNPKTLRDKQQVKAKAANNEENAIRWIFALEEFQKVPTSDFITQALSKAIDRSMESPGKIKDIWFDSRQIKSKTSVQFTADVRPVSPARRQLVDLWFEKNGFPPNASSSLMAQEARFIDGNNEYWIVMRNKTLDDIVKNIKKGDSIVLNTILAGAVKNGDKVDWVFLSGESSF
jgi:hypothetical protein